MIIIFNSTTIILFPISNFIILVEEKLMGLDAGSRSAEAGLCCWQSLMREREREKLSRREGREMLGLATREDRPICSSLLFF